MKDSSLARNLDKYLGSFVCLFFSILQKLRFRKKHSKIKNLLFIELFEMGAAVMAYPSLVYAKTHLKDPNIYVLCLDRGKSVWNLLNIIPEKNIITINSSGLFSFAFSIIGAVWKMRKLDLDIIIDLELFMRISALISFMTKAKVRAGFNRYHMEGLYRGSFYDIPCNFNQNMHYAKNFLSLTKAALALDSKYPNYKGSIDDSEVIAPSYTSDKALADKIVSRIKKKFPSFSNQKIFLISPDVGKYLSIRTYPRDSYVYIIKELLKKYDALVLLVGVEDNFDTCDSIRNQVSSSRCINFCNQTDSIVEFIELVLMSEILLGNDNGHAHFASFTQTPIVTIFGPETGLLYGPLGRCIVLYSHFNCSPCLTAFNHKKSGCQNNLCLKAIPKERVLETVCSVIDGKNIKFRTINGEIKYI